MAGSHLSNECRLSRPISSHERSLFKLSWRHRMPHGFGVPCFCLLSFRGYWHSELDTVDFFLNVTLFGFTFVLYGLGPMHHTFESAAVPNRMSWIHFFDGLKTVCCDWSVLRCIYLSVYGTLQLAV